jgi:hypothetical protein
MSDNAGIELVEWKEMQRNTLRGFATVRLRSGLTIRDCGVHTANGKAWASLPSKPIVDRDGQAQRDQSTGKIRYVPIVEWQSRDVANRFSAAVVEAVEARYPGAVHR